MLYCKIYGLCGRVVSLLDYQLRGRELKSPPQQNLMLRYVLLLLPPLANSAMMSTLTIYTRGAQPFWAKGRSVLFLVHSRAEEKNYKLNFQESSVENRICFILQAFYCLWFDIVAIRA